MKKFKIALLFLILAVLFVVVYQNWDFFSATKSMTVNLKMKTYQTPEIANGLYFLGCFFIGFLIAYTSGLMAKFKASKMIKELNAAIDSQQKKISTLRGDMDLLKRNPVVKEAAPQESEPVTNPTLQQG